jgi:acetylornithine deacetylase/succinyl-diaminopimelate desuccinylase-like protein
MSDRLTLTKELLGRLVAFDTTSSKSNLGLISFVEGYLEGFGIKSYRVPNADGLKSSLFATIGPSGVGGIGLSGHTDVVPVAGQAWDTDPFTMVERDGKLYGRGTCDMKGYLACVLASVPELVARPLKTPMHIVFSYDEEVGCTGVRPMVAELGKTLPLPRMVFVGEPTEMGVVDAHKGPGALARRGDGTCRAFEHGASRRQRHRLRRSPAGGAGAHGGGVEGAAARSALRSALDHPAGNGNRRRHGVQHRAGAVLVRLGDSRAARLRLQAPRRAPAPLRRR